MSALALVSDLMFRSQLEAAAQRAGVKTSIVASAEALLAASETLRPALVILDLSHPGLDPDALVPALRSALGKPACILAFGPHVHQERLAAAERAGCDAVISRGQFHAQMQNILEQQGQ